MSIADIELRVITRDGEELDSRLFRAHRAGHLRPDTQGLGSGKDRSRIWR